jgi:hypothetical protein
MTALLGNPEAVTTIPTDRPAVEAALTVVELSVVERPP